MRIIYPEKLNDDLHKCAPYMYYNKTEHKMDFKLGTPQKIKDLYQENQKARREYEKQFYW